uniref:Uncharacterized protein n=1 Tax=Globisporangium ultimum (strain ATCC 200006 / CBS 805.95 / DAOM BR144) TaxID=431595 RepID=K3X4M1_GLOUD
ALSKWTTRDFRQRRALILQPSTERFHITNICNSRYSTHTGKTTSITRIHSPSGTRSLRVRVNARLVESR